MHQCVTVDQGKYLQKRMERGDKADQEGCKKGGCTGYEEEERKEDRRKRG